MVRGITMGEKTICVDFDGVLHRYSEGYKDGTIYDGEKAGAGTAIRKLISSGYEVVVFTARQPEQFKQIRTWLKVFVGEEYALKLEVTNIKPPAIAYIDDRAIRFTNWDDMLKYFALT